MVRRSPCRPLRRGSDSSCAQPRTARRPRPSALCRVRCGSAHTCHGSTAGSRTDKLGAPADTV
eukprot:7385715-Prymnesium_polylepis.2